MGRKDICHARRMGKRRHARKDLGRGGIGETWQRSWGASVQIGTIGRQTGLTVLALIICVVL